MPVTTFKISIKVKGQEHFQRVRKMVEDCTELFNAIIERWMTHNKDKFEQSRGAESTGVTFGDVLWVPVQSEYSAEKRKAGFEDWLMVRTGELRQSLIERKAFGWWEEVTDRSAAFGTRVDKAVFNMQTRPVMFLDETDQGMITDMVGAWLNGEAPFAPYRAGEVERMDSEFKAMINPVGDIRPIKPTLPSVAPSRG